MTEEQGVELAQVLERREVALREWRSLSSRSKQGEEAALERLKELNLLADDVAEGEARGREEEQRRCVVDMEAKLTEAEALVHELGERLEGERSRLRVLERETLKARCYDPAARAGVETVERQEAEQVEWYARQRPHRPEEWPVELCEQIAERVKQLQAESEASRARRREEARRSWLPSGRSRAG